MSFTVKDFPNRVFETYAEFEKALFERDRIERELKFRRETNDEITRVTATIIPAPQELVMQRHIELERKVDQLNELIATLRQNSSGEALRENKDGVKVGTILRGESKGKSYTLQSLEDGYLCSDGNTYATLSAAALGVSGNRRSGWKFWTDIEGKPIGETTGRFKTHATDNPFLSG